MKFRKTYKMGADAFKRAPVIGDEVQDLSLSEKELRDLEVLETTQTYFRNMLLRKSHIPISRNTEDDSN